MTFIDRVVVALELQRYFFAFAQAPVKYFSKRFTVVGPDIFEA
ncbi:hypothetical protein [Caldalkalibacillus thermarum]|nr:hypothetical protein [Caldalkalibacillus thermarum]